MGVNVSFYYIQDDVIPARKIELVSGHVEVSSIVIGCLPHYIELNTTVNVNKKK